MSRPRLTVFTSTIYPDLPRLWHACVTRALPPGEAVVEVFHDADAFAPLEERLPGTVVLRRGPGRREFHEAYNDAVRRASTPYLAFVDTDVFLTSRALWPRLAEALVPQNVAAVAAVSRTQAESHGTFAVVVKAAVYRDVLERLPEGFFPGFDVPSAGAPPSSWRFRDAGDRMTEAVITSGHEVRLLDLGREGELARFDAITLTRRAAELFGERPLLRLLAENDYYWHGVVGNAVLARLHDRLFPDGPRFGFRAPLGAALRRALRGRPGEVKVRLGYVARLARAARRVAGFVRGNAPVYPPGTFQERRGGAG